MEKIDELKKIFENNIKKFKEFHLKKILEYKKKSELAIKEILGNEFKNTWEYIQNMTDGKERKMVHYNFIREFALACSKICIHNNPGVIAHLEKTLLTKAETKWIIPTTELFAILKEIKSNKYLLPPETLYLIDIYLGNKISVAIVEKFRYGSLKYPISPFENITSEVINSKRRKKPKGEFDKALADLEESLKPISNTFPPFKTVKTVSKLIQNMNSRELDKILLPIYDEALSVEKNNPQKNKFRALYPLFATVLKDKNWNNDMTILYGGTEKGKDYRKIEQRMRKFIFKK